MKELFAISHQRSAKKSWRLCAFAFLWCAFLFSACIPARVPDNLDDTPGAPVSVSDHHYSGEDFSVDYPEGWRVVTGEARVPQSVILVAPDEVSYIRLHVGQPAPDDAAPDLKSDSRTITLANSITVTAVLNAPTESFDALLPDFERVMASVTAS